MNKIIEIFFIDTIMNYLIEVWNWLSGKKSKIALALLFIYGGLSYLGIELTLLKDIALWLGGVGVLHGAFKAIVK